MVEVALSTGMNAYTRADHGVSSDRSRLSTVASPIAQVISLSGTNQPFRNFLHRGYGWTGRTHSDEPSYGFNAQDERSKLVEELHGEATSIWGGLSLPKTAMPKRELFSFSASTTPRGELAAFVRDKTPGLSLGAQDELVSRIAEYEWTYATFPAHLRPQRKHEPIAKTRRPGQARGKHTIHGGKVIRVSFVPGTAAPDTEFPTSLLSVLDIVPRPNLASLNFAERTTTPAHDYMKFDDLALPPVAGPLMGAERASRTTPRPTNIVRSWELAAA